MLPHAYGPPAAILLVLSGTLACFAGYRLFRIVLGIYGFILGALFASSMMGTTNTVGMIVAAAVGGVVGSVILVFAYFIGIAIAGAGLGALVANMAWPQVGSGDPPVALVIVLALLGTIGAMFLQRYVIIVSTAFGGAWSIIVGGLALSAAPLAERAAGSGDVWILYPMTRPPGQGWVPIAWIALGVFGTAVQLGVTGKKRK
jgi:Domain of unknown function (DUF4203)